MELSSWLNARNSFRHSKNRSCTFKTKNKILIMKVKLKLCRKKTSLSNSIKCLGVRFDENLDWKDLRNELVSKLIRGNVITIQRKLKKNEREM